jgi:hypothetical protein
MPHVARATAVVHFAKLDRFGPVKSGGAARSDVRDRILPCMSELFRNDPFLRGPFVYGVCQKGDNLSADVATK